MDLTSLSKFAISETKVKVSRGD